MRYLIKFSKEGYLKYISHLDMIRLFKRAFKKSGLHLEHSQGFNPHPKMTFAQPLSLGYTSIGELLEIETKMDFEPLEVKKKLQETMPDGIMITGCEVINDKNKGVAGRVIEAEYVIEIDDFDKNNVKKIDEFINLKEIKVLKKQKKKKELKEIDIKPKIRSLKYKISDCNKLIMTTKVDCGSSSNLNPDLIIKALSLYLDIEIPSENVEIQRNYLKYN